MNPVDKARLKQLYLEDTGQNIPDTDFLSFIEGLGLYFRSGYEMDYKNFIDIYTDGEPDCIAIQDYIEWLENRAIEQK